MQPGRELDALVAEKVMGFKRFNQPPDYDGNYGGEPVLFPPGVVPEKSGWQWPPKGRVSMTSLTPRYSTSIADAWQVVEKLRKEMCCLKFYSDHDYIWECYGIKDDDDEDHNNLCIVTYKIYAQSESLPHAICLAALKAVGSHDLANK